MINMHPLILPFVLVIVGGQTDGNADQDRQRTSLLALARLHRLVAPHHPSLDAARADWPARLRKVIPDVLRAENDEQLTKALQQYVAGLEGPTIEIGSPNEHPPANATASREGPVVRWLDDILYIALSPGDCCPSAIPEIEEALEHGPSCPAGWVLDLRETQYRGFGSIYSEVKVTLAWAFEQGARTPARLGRQHLVTQGDNEAWPELIPMRSYVEQEKLALPSDAIALVDETTHPAVTGWLMTSGIVDFGDPVPAMADWPCVVPLTETVAAKCVLTRYAYDGGDKLYAVDHLCPEELPNGIPPVDELHPLVDNIIIYTMGYWDRAYKKACPLLSAPLRSKQRAHVEGNRAGGITELPESPGQHPLVDKVTQMILQLAAIEPINDQCPAIEDAAEAAFLQELDKLLNIEEMNR